jgi:hemolysin activation/secretion protein
VKGIRLAAFYDIGNVWFDAYRYRLDDLASSWGMGLRFDMPGFPIRIDRAWVVRRDDDLTDADPWVFWIGYDY